MARPTYEQLEDLLVQKDRRIAQLEARVAQLEAQKDRRVAELEAQVQKLTAQLQEVLRASKRQAAPFFKGEPKANPKSPGRKAGTSYGPKAHREIPRGQPDEVLDVPLPPTRRAHGTALEGHAARPTATRTFLGTGTTAPASEWW